MSDLVYGFDMGRNVKFFDYSEDYYRNVMKSLCKEAQRSPDPSTQNAAVLVGPDGVISQTLSVNEFPYGVEYNDERWERPLKYEFIEHAERNAVYAAASIGRSTFGLTLVCPWAACSDCARALIQGRIGHLVTMRPIDGDTNERWQKSIENAMTMLKEARVKVDFLDGPLGIDFDILRDGQPFRP